MAYNAPNFSIPNFLGGVNEAIDETLIKLNECKSMQNFDTERGVLSTSLGVKKYSNAQLLNKIETLIGYYKNDTSQILAMSNGHIYRLEGDTFNDIASGFTSNVFDSINFTGWEGDVLILGNGVENTKVYNGTTFRNIKRNGKDAVDGVLAPKIKFIELHYERTWGAGDKDNPDRVYFSTSNVNGFDYDDWSFPITEGQANQHGGFIDIPTNDGGHIIGLKVIFNDVVIFKKNNIFKIFGNYPGNYSKVQIFSANGGISDRTISAGNNKAYFVAKDGIYMYDGTNVIPIHEKVKDTFENINKTYIDKSIGIFHKNHYILAVPEGSSTVNNLIIDFNTVNNTYKLKRGFVVNSFLVYEDKLLFADDNGNVNIYGEGNDFNGAVINANYETGFKDMGAQNAIKTSQYIYFIGSGNGSVRFTLKAEGNINKVLDIPLISTEKPYKKQLKNKGRLLSLLIENVNGSNITIKAPTVICDVDYD